MVNALLGVDMKAFFLKAIQLPWTRSDGDFAEKVVVRYRTQQPMSSFAKNLFEHEDARSLNDRLNKARTKAFK
ncbi:hypothetical protein CTN01_18045 [Photobacterium angustum]|nr:hypothetical protein CTN01_18045 [Photobacterium angustum]